MTTGREIARRARWPLFLLSNALSVIPRFATETLWRLADYLPGTLGVGMRYACLKALASSVGENVYLGPFVVAKNLNGLRVGSNVSIHAFCYLDADGTITIGDNVSIAHGSSLLSFDHSWDDSSRPIKYNPVHLKPLIIHEDVWIGCGVRILGGVTIRSRSIVAAGAVVNRDVDGNTLVAGVPARVVRSL